MLRSELVNLVRVIALSAFAFVATCSPSEASVFDEVNPVCAVDRQGVSGDLQQLANLTIDYGYVFEANRRAGDVSAKLARKLFLDRTGEGKPDAGAANKVLQGKDDDAVSLIQDYILGVTKTKITGSPESVAVRALLLAYAEQLIECVNGVRQLPPAS